MIKHLHHTPGEDLKTRRQVLEALGFRFEKVNTHNWTTYAPNGTVLHTLTSGRDVAVSFHPPVECDAQIALDTLPLPTAWQWQLVMTPGAETQFASIVGPHGQKLSAGAPTLAGAMVACWLTLRQSVDKMVAKVVR